MITKLTFKHDAMAEAVGERLQKEYPAVETRIYFAPYNEIQTYCELMQIAVVLCDLGYDPYVTKLELE